MQEKFKEISHAYKTLSDDRLRKEYNDRLFNRNSQTFTSTSRQNQAKPNFKHRFYKRVDPNSGFTYETDEEYLKNMNNQSSNRQKPKYNNGENDFYEEGLLNSLKASPELWILTIIIAACAIRWMFLFMDMMNNFRQADFYTDENGVIYKQKQF